MEYVNVCKLKKIVILKLQNAIRRLEAGYSLNDTLLELASVVKEIKRENQIKEEKVMTDSNIITKMKNMHYQYKTDATKPVGQNQRLINKSKAEAIKEVLEKLFNIEVV